MSKQLTPRESTIRAGLVARQKQISSLLGDKKKSDKFIATAILVANDYKLAKCNPESVLDACVNVAQMGLDLSPTLSHAYLVPYGQNVQLIVSAKGYTALLARTGWKIKSFIVTTDDEFSYKMDGFDESVKFIKDLDGTNEAVFRYAVAMAKSPDGTLYVEVMNKSQVEKHRLVSATQKGPNPTGVWKDWADDMAKKTVIKKLVKSLPLGEDIALATEIDDKPIEAELIEDSKPATPSSLNEMDFVPEHNPNTGEVIDEPDLLEDIEIVGAK